MTTLISSEHGRCDARCYNGKPETRCACICGGKNHAKGLAAALENTREFGLNLLPPGEVSGAVRDLVLDGEAKILFRRKEFDAAILVALPGQRPEPLRHVVKHSPTGMNFGYGGSGPADAARSILTYFYGPQVADRLYMGFKWKFIGGIDQEKGGELSFDTIDAWVKEQPRYREEAG